MSDTEATAFVVETIGGDESIPVIAVHGQADLHTAPQLRAAITTALDGGAPGLVIDLSEATFIDSMTLGVLLGAVKRLRPSRRHGQRRLHRLAHPADLRDHAARPRVLDPCGSRRRARRRANGSA